MARPMEFDPELALQMAIKVFYDHGYEGSSTAELLARMGIARQSLYGAFGDKRRLFLRSLERYNSASVAELAEALGSKRNSIESLEAALLAFALLLVAWPSRPRRAAVLAALTLLSLASMGAMLATLAPDGLQRLANRAIDDASWRRQ